MKIGYLRVSTEEQNLDRQIDGLNLICDELHIEKISGKNTWRPVYQMVKSKLRGGDTLVVWDLDRAFRSTIDALLEAEELRKRMIEFQIVSLNLDTETPSGELVYTVMAAYAQFERKTLIKRTKEGIRAARARGKIIGRPRMLTDEQIDYAREKLYFNQSTITDIARELGCNRKTLAKALRFYEKAIF